MPRLQRDPCAQNLDRERKRGARETVLEHLAGGAHGIPPVGGAPTRFMDSVGFDRTLRPHPREWASGFTTKKGRRVWLRPIRPEDEPLMIDFHRTLSDETVYSRYFGPMRLEQRIEHERLARLCLIDYDQPMALVAEYEETGGGAPRIGGVGRLIRLCSGRDAEYALVVSDDLQGEGLGAELLRRLIEIARVESLDRIVGDVLPDNRRMLRLCRRLGFALHRRVAAPVLAELRLAR